jgi:glycosyltransferase involved in cell wall biosynthesis
MMHSRPSVSILMLTMDRPQFVDGAIASVRAQSYSDWELIVVHDGPDQRVAAAVRSWVEQDPRVVYLHREKVGNIANALNHGLQAARGEFVAILDDDDAWLDSEKLAKQVTLLRERSDIVVVGGGAIVVDGEGREILRYTRPQDPATCARRALIANPLIHSTVVYRRDVIRELGGYDDSLRGYQDWDLFLKVMRRYGVTNLPAFLTYYRVWDGGGSSRKVLGNAWSSVRIVNRHRDAFPRGWTALSASWAYVLFALLPGGIRRRCYQSLTRLKKRLFSS